MNRRGSEPNQRLVLGRLLDRDSGEWPPECNEFDSKGRKLDIEMNTVHPESN